MRALGLLLRSLALTALFFVLIAGAAAVGRATSTTLIVARQRTYAVDRLDMVVVDLNRGVSLTRRIRMPFAVSVDWSMSPPQVIQRTPTRDSTVFTLSRLDVARARLIPLVTHRTANETRTRSLDIALSRSRAAVYVPTTGEVTLLNADRTARLTVRVESGITQPLVWSPDGERLAIKEYRAPELTLLDNAGARRFEAFRDSAPVWSPDSQRILFTQDSFVERNGRIRVYDAVTGEILPAANDLPGRSGTWCDSDTLAFVRVTPDGLHTIQVLELESGQIAQVFDAATASSQEILSITFAPRPACDWLLVSMRYPNELASRLYRLYVPTGEFIRLGDNARILSLTPDALIYDSNTANVALTVAQIPFETGAKPDVYGRVPSQIEDVTWFSEFRRGLFLRSGELWSLDLTTGSAAPLPLSVPILTFQVAEPQ